jgi:hypothetical protein
VGRCRPVIRNLILAEPGDIAVYGQLFGRLRDAALPPAGSLSLLTGAATELPGQ